MKIQKNHDRTLMIYFILATLIFSLVLSACSAVSPETAGDDPPSPTATAEQKPEPTPAPEATENPFGDWMEYTSETIGFRFLYPGDWFGPEANESEGSLRIEVGSDQVYPYGTSREDQITTIPDSYYITIQYFENIEGRTWQDFIDSGWITAYLDLLDLQDGESVATARSLTIREREVSLGAFQGLEYIATLPENAQTERVYLREIMAFDEDLNWLRVTGFPNMVEIKDLENWKADYSRVDLANLEIFTTLAESIEIK